MNVRVIPSLLLYRGGLVKTKRYKKPVYIGDPINAVKIFNDKRADELMFLDIEATKSGAEPNFELLADIAGEAFMPFAYGGGITNIAQVKKLFRIGIEKVVIGTAAGVSGNLIPEVASLAGCSSVVASVDVRRGFFGRDSVYVRNGSKDLMIDPVEYSMLLEHQGAGEILLNSIDHDGMQQGFNLNLISSVSASTSIPVIASCGAGKLQDFKDAVDAGASAVAAGSIFVFHGNHNAVLFTYPEYSVISNIFKSDSNESINPV